MLQVSGLRVSFATADGELQAVRAVDFSVRSGEILAIVGESGSGKTQLAMALMGLLAENGSASGSALFQGHDLLGCGQKQMNRLRGSKLAMIFQDPESTLNPYMSIGRQMSEVLEQHCNMSHKQAWLVAEEMLHQVRIDDAHERMRQFPYELSGGMLQRIIIAMALLCQPALLIADEPTTALDVTVQADINRLMLDLRERYQTAIILITHDLGMVAGLADQVLVMYAGQTMEYAAVADLYQRPEHPYSRGLLRAIPQSFSNNLAALQPIPGNPPNPMQLPSGCPFRDRCEYAFADCTATPLLRPARHGGLIACHLDRLPE
ncbi:MAG: ATP-binding cassette domain-containing protein [Gammaproteobacteria bacterium]|nr:ATP-binding cassette domain-containing protein [Gammaproteobacteria bacterium]